MIKLRDGVHIETDREIILDSKKALGDLNLISHAHIDHLLNKEVKVIASEETSEIASNRTNKNLETISDKKIELIPSGHILGSRSALIKGNKKILYTGDICKKPRMYLEGYNPPKADELIIESTYGKKHYIFPEIKEIKNNVLKWVRENKNKNLFLFCYSLGKSQKIQYFLENNINRNIYQHKSIIKINKIYNKIKDLELSQNKIKDASINKNSLFLFPQHLSRAKKINKLTNKFDAKKAGFSGWAINKSFNHRRDFDRSFLFSDHADYLDLINVVKKVDPEKVYTYHGFSEELAKNIRRDLGIEATQLKEHQTTLNDY